MTSSIPDTLKRMSDAKSYFKPPSGGDLTLRSSDGVDFLVHSPILKLAASIFDDMVSTGTTKDIVELAENAVDVSYLLRFIYPNRFPVAISIDDLPNCLSIVQKYDVGGALDIIDELVALDSPPHKPLSSNPVRAYQLAVQFSLTKTKVAVAPLVTVDKINFCNLGELQHFTQTYPPLQLIPMMNLQAMKSKALFDILFDFRDKPMLPPNSSLFYILSCGDCRPGDRLKNMTEGCKQSPTTWTIAWARLAYETLLVSPLDKSEFLFQNTVLQRFTNNEYVCQKCISRIGDSKPYRSDFESWVGGVRKCLETQLKRLEPLYAI